MSKQNKILKQKFSKITTKYLDQDYLQKLDSEALLFLAAFNEAEAGDTRKLEKIRKLSKGQKKEFTDLKNERSRDLLNHTRPEEFLDEPVFDETTGENKKEATVQKCSIADLADDATTWRGKQKNAYRKAKKK